MTMRLSEIDPEQLAETEYQRAVDRVHSLLLALAPMSTYTLTLNNSGWRASVYGHAVYCLARYAKHGAALDADVHEYCVSLIGPGSHALDDAAEVEPDPTTTLGMVVAAALARETVQLGNAITIAQLAILGSVTPGRLRQIADAGDLKVSRRGEVATVSAKEAQRWLSGRGVGGFAETK